MSWPTRPCEIGNRDYPDACIIISHVEQKEKKTGGENEKRGVIPAFVKKDSAISRRMTRRKAW